MIKKVIILLVLCMFVFSVPGFSEMNFNGHGLTHSNDRYLTEHFKVKEFFHSTFAETFGINNNPPVDTLQQMNVMFNLILLSVEILEPIRGMIGDKPIIIVSGYRSPLLNKLVGGVKNSQHLSGEAVDFFVSDELMLPIFYLIKRSGLNYDQLILEHGEWIHVSYTRGYNRRQEIIVD